MCSLVLLYPPLLRPRIACASIVKGRAGEITVSAVFSVGLAFFSTKLVMCAACYAEQHHERFVLVSENTGFHSLDILDILMLFVPLLSKESSSWVVVRRTALVDEPSVGL